MGRWERRHQDFSCCCLLPLHRRPAFTQTLQLLLSPPPAQTACLHTDTTAVAVSSPCTDGLPSYRHYSCCCLPPPPSPCTDGLPSYRHYSCCCLLPLHRWPAFIQTLQLLLSPPPSSCTDGLPSYRHYSCCCFPPPPPPAQTACLHTDTTAVAVSSPCTDGLPSHRHYSCCCLLPLHKRPAFTQTLQLLLSPPPLPLHRWPAFIQTLQLLLSPPPAQMACLHTDTPRASVQCETAFANVSGLSRSL